MFLVTCIKQNNENKLPTLRNLLHRNTELLVYFQIYWMESKECRHFHFVVPVSPDNKNVSEKNSFCIIMRIPFCNIYII